MDANGNTKSSSSLAPCQKGYAADCNPMDVMAITAVLDNILVDVTEKQCYPVVFELPIKDYTDDCHPRDAMTLLDIHPVNVLVK